MNKIIFSLAIVILSAINAVALDKKIIELAVQKECVNMFISAKVTVLVIVPFDASITEQAGTIYKGIGTMECFLDGNLFVVWSTFTYYEKTNHVQGEVIGIFPKR